MLVVKDEEDKTVGYRDEWARGSYIDGSFHVKLRVSLVASWKVRDRLLSSDNFNVAEGIDVLCVPWVAGLVHYLSQFIQPGHTSRG